MWALHNKTPFAAGKAFERDRDGHEVLCLAMRATLQPRGDGLWVPTEVQAPVRLAPELGETEMIADADIVPFLPGAEVTVQGTVSGELPDDGRVAQIAVGDIRHQLRLWPPMQARRDRRRVVLEHLEPADLPLTWAHAAGGPLPDGTLHPANPLGTGLIPFTEEAPTPLPRILGLTDRPDQLGPDTHPVGTGPIHRHWWPRLTAAGTYGDDWEATQAPCLPTDFDARFYFSAPPALQQAHAFRSGEPIVLTGFGEGKDMQMRLPTVLAVTMTEIGRDRIEQRMALQRIQIDLNQGTVGLLWLAAVPCDGRDHLIRASTMYLKQMSGIAL